MKRIDRERKSTWRRKWRQSEAKEGAQEKKQNRKRSKPWRRQDKARVRRGPELEEEKRACEHKTEEENESPVNLSILIHGIDE